MFRQLSGTNNHAATAAADRLFENFKCVAGEYHTHYNRNGISTQRP
jgi:hypothetical protein